MRGDGFGVERGFELAPARAPGRALGRLRLHCLGEFGPGLLEQRFQPCFVVGGGLQIADSLFKLQPFGFPRQAIGAVGFEDGGELVAGRVERRGELGRHLRRAAL